MSNPFSSPQTPQPPPFKKVDIAATTNAATNFANLGYQQSEADFLTRFPGLVAIRDSEINQAAADITGPIDPATQNQFTSTAETGALSAFGGGQGNIGEVGSAARGATAGGIESAVANQQDTNWMNFFNMLNTFPEQSLTIDPSTALNFLMGNVVGKNQAGFGGYQQSVQQANTNRAATLQEGTAAAQIAISLASILAAA